MRESADAKARRYLVEARIRIRDADEDGGVVLVEVRGDSGRIYATGYGESGWFCSCPTVGPPRCSHVRALQLITVMEPRS